VEVEAEAVRNSHLIQYYALMAVLVDQVLSLLPTQTLLELQH
jgi:hypothetical protein